MNTFKTTVDMPVCPICRARLVFDRNSFFAPRERCALIDVKCPCCGNDDHILMVEPSRPDKETFSKKKTRYTGAHKDYQTVSTYLRYLKRINEVYPGTLIVSERLGIRLDICDRAFRSEWEHYWHVDLLAVKESRICRDEPEDLPF